ncbi:MAG TPA: ABC transporter permease [Thermomicrobiales bacterium]|nr:ABC transporter permease [Thermomicrobiales bacterium]
MLNLGARNWAREVRSSYAFVERNWNLTRRYWGWEIAFFIYRLASSLSVVYIGKAQGASGRELIVFLTVGTLVWEYLSAVFSNIGEMIQWERWEGTIEYTLMAPIRRTTQMLGTSVFAVLYGLVRTLLLFGAIALFFDLDLSRADYFSATVVLLAGSLSFIGIGIMASTLPLLFTERGGQMVFIIGSLLLLVSGVYYPITVLPGWMQAIAKVSPATYVLDGTRQSILQGAGLPALWGHLVILLVIGVVTIPFGVWFFIRVEIYAKRTGRLKRSG